MAGYRRAIGISAFSHRRELHYFDSRMPLCRRFYDTLPFTRATSYPHYEVDY